jgi:Arc/MetJ-type ribon-helix-helix transcriptional regulator
VYEQIHAGLYSTEDDVIRDALEQLRTHTQRIARGQESPGSLRDEPSSQELQRRLFDAGLVTEIKPPITDMTPYQDRQAISMRGEPISETVIRERR